jgi:hypothetical protein
VLLLLLEVVVQQASPALAPQVAQTLPVHLVPEAVQYVPVLEVELVLQHGCPGPPHKPELQAPF